MKYSFYNEDEELMATIVAEQRIELEGGYVIVLSCKCDPTENYEDLQNACFILDVEDETYEESDTVSVDLKNERALIVIEY